MRRCRRSTEALTATWSFGFEIGPNSSKIATSETTNGKSRTEDTRPSAPLADDAEPCNTDQKTKVTHVFWIALTILGSPTTRVDA